MLINIFHKKYEKTNIHPDSKSPTWCFGDNPKESPLNWDLNQEVARWEIMFPEWAGYYWEIQFYDAG